MDGGPSPTDGLTQKVNELTALLCEACAAWGKEMPPSLFYWHARHQEQDRRRLIDLQRRRVENIARLERERRQIDEELIALKEG